MTKKGIKTEQSKYVGIDLFAGAGGMSLGAVQAGIDVKLAIEFDTFASATHAHNHKDAKVFADDIRNFTAEHLKAMETEFAGKTKILFGGPPCQGFSTSNIRGRKMDNPKNWLFKEYLRIVNIWNPDWMVIENVKGLLDTEKGFFLEEIKKELTLLGYSISQWVLNSADFGVPQKRNRLFVVGSRHGLTIKEPHPSTTHNVSVKEAISDLPDLESGANESILPYKCSAESEYSKKMRGSLTVSPNHLVTRNTPLTLERYKYIHQGGNWKNIPDGLMQNYKEKNNCHTGIYYRLKNDEPSVVLGNYRKNMFIHPTQDRGLSVREAARLQSFPDWFEFKGSIGFQQQQVGNAVPPLLAKVVFEKIVEHEI